MDLEKKRSECLRTYPCIKRYPWPCRKALSCRFGHLGQGIGHYVGSEFGVPTTLGTNLTWKTTSVISDTNIIFQTRCRQVDAGLRLAADKVVQ